MASGQSLSDFGTLGRIVAGLDMIMWFGILAPAQVMGLGLVIGLAGIGPLPGMVDGSPVYALGYVAVGAAIAVGPLLQRRKSGPWRRGVPILLLLPLFWPTAVLVGRLRG